MEALSKDNKLLISSILLYTLAIFPVLRPALQSILLITFSLVSLLFYYKTFIKRIRNKNLIITFVCLTAYYFWQLLSIFWSEDKLAAIEAIQSTLLLLLFPLVFIFFYPALSRKIVRRVQWIFILSMSFYTLLWVKSHLDGLDYYYVLRLKETAFTEQSVWQQITSFYEQGYYWVSGSAIRGYRMAAEENNLFLHHGYLSAYYLLGLLFCLKEIKECKAIWSKGVLLITMTVFGIILLFLPSIVNKLAALVLIPLLLYHLYSKRLVIGLAIIGLVGLGFYAKEIQTGFSELRWVEKESLISQKPVIIDYFRYHIYNCIEDKVPDNYIFGMGGIDIQSHLNDCLPDDKWPGLSESKLVFNTHSQFLHYFISGGIVGLLLFLLLWAKLVSLAASKKNIMLLIVLIIVIFNSLFENFLARIWGVFFFTFFVFININTEPSQIKNRTREQ